MADGEEPGEEPRAAAEGVHTPPSSRPLVLPEVYDGTSSWDGWAFHFENVAAVNRWDDADKLRWLRVRLTGRAQKALQRLPETSASTYAAARAALKARFDPESRHTRYQAEFQARRKKATEGWADFADDLKALADKAYPTLQDEAREQLAINSFLQQLMPPQVAFSVKQKRPASLDDAVAATLELESYVSPPTAGVSATQPEEAVCSPVTSEARHVEQLTKVVKQLAEQVERLQTAATRPQQRRIRPFSGECWRCGQPGHMARNCRQNSWRQPEN
jgi:hypothetical protein